ncbi:hypothetical protein VTO42DRAFT_2852 [Malbranchea cinnamomea]
MDKNNPWEISKDDVKRAKADGLYDDCLACKATGSAALIGLGGYSYYTGMRNLKAREQEILKSGSKYRMGSRKLGIFTISATLVAMGIWRAFN